MKNVYMCSFIRKFIVILSTAFTTAMIARSLGPELKGEYAYFLSIINISVIATQFGYYKLYAKYVKEKTRNISNYFFSLTIYKGCVIFLFLSVIWMIIYRNDYSFIHLIILIAIIADTISSELLFYLIVDNINSYNFVSIIASLYNVVALSVAYFLFKENLLALLYIYIGKSVLIIVFFVIWEKRCLISDEFLYQILKDGIKIIIYPMLAGVLTDLNYKIDIFFLESMTTNYLVGIYSTGVTLSEIVWIIPDTFKEVLFHKTAKEDATSSIALCLRISNTIMILSMGFVALFGEKIIQFLFGIEYLESYVVTVILLFGAFSMSVFKILNPLYQSLGKWKLYTGILLISVIINILLNLLVIPVIGIYGAALSSVVSYSICGFVLLYYFLHDYQMDFRRAAFIGMGDIKELLNRLQISQIES